MDSLSTGLVTKGTIGKPSLDTESICILLVMGKHLLLSRVQLTQLPWHQSRQHQASWPGDIIDWSSLSGLTAQGPQEPPKVLSPKHNLMSGIERLQRARLTYTGVFTTPQDELA